VQCSFVARCLLLKYDNIIDSNWGKKQIASTRSE